MSPKTPALRIGFLPFYVDYYEGICPDFPFEKQAICERLAEVLRGFGDVLWEGRMIQDHAQATAAGRALAEQSPDCVVAFTSIAVFSAIPMAALQAVACPLLVWNAQQIETVGDSYTMKEIVRNTGQIGTQALANTLVRTGRSFRILTGYESAPRTRKELGAFLGVVHAAKAVRRARLLAVGEPFPAMLDILVDEAVLRREIGVEVVRVDQAEWTRRNEAVQPERVASRVADIYQRHPVSEMSEAQRLAAVGIECEVFDLRTLAPLDREGICASVRKTGRLVIVHEGVKTGGAGAEIAQTAIEGAFDFLQAPIIRVTSEDLPIPPGTLQDLVFLHAADIEAAVKKVLM